jgi:hypothetical protein
MFDQLDYELEAAEKIGTGELDAGSFQLNVSKHRHCGSECWFWQQRILSFGSTSLVF